MLWSDKLVELDLTDSKVQTVSSSICMRESDQSVKVIKGRNVRSNDYFVCFNDAIMLVLLLTHVYSRSYYMTCTICVGHIEFQRSAKISTKTQRCLLIYITSQIGSKTGKE